MSTNIPTTLAQPAQRALVNAGIASLEQLKTFSESEIKALHGMGPNAMKKLRDAMAASNIEFAAKKE